MKNHLQEIQSLIINGVNTHSPFEGGIGGGTIFTGSFDWHSCVHAHWALLEIDQKISENNTFIFNRLTEQNLAKELEYLMLNPAFEKPYGRAWLYLLLCRVNRLEFSVFRDWLKNDLMTWLRQSAFPEQEKYILGTHQSWLFCFFLMILSTRARSEDLSMLKNIEQEKLEPIRFSLELFDHLLEGDRWDFINRSSLLATIDGLMGRELSQQQKDHLYREKDFLMEQSFTIKDRTQSHEPGRYVMQSWPFVFFDIQSSEEIVNKVLENKSCWSDSFDWVSHWVPQFIIMSSFLKNYRSI